MSPDVLDDCQDAIAEVTWNNMLSAIHRLKCKEISVDSWVGDIRMEMLGLYVSQFGVCNGEFDKNISVQFDGHAWHCYKPHFAQDCRYIDQMAQGVRRGAYGEYLEFGNFIERVKLLLLED